MNSTNGNTKKYIISRLQEQDHHPIEGIIFSQDRKSASEAQLRGDTLKNTYYNEKKKKKKKTKTYTLTHGYLTNKEGVGSVSSNLLSRILRGRDEWKVLRWIESDHHPKGRSAKIFICFPLWNSICLPTWSYNDFILILILDRCFFLVYLLLLDSSPSTPKIVYFHLQSVGIIWNNFTSYHSFQTNQSIKWHSFHWWKRWCLDILL